MVAHSKGANAKTQVVGARFTPHEVAAIDILRGNTDRGTWMAGLVRRALDKARKDGKL